MDPLEFFKRRATEYLKAESNLFRDKKSQAAIKKLIAHVKICGVKAKKKVKSETKAT